jgi:mannosyl-oligosaccharide glucosidase
MMQRVGYIVLTCLFFAASVLLVLQYQYLIVSLQLPTITGMVLKAAANSVRAVTDSCFHTNKWRPNQVDTPSIARLKKNSMPLWGSYRPGVYFGMKKKYSSPAPVATGIMWTALIGSGKSWRDQTSQDELRRFDWIRHNGKDYGEQRLVDESYNMDIDVSFVVQDTSGHRNQPAWMNRISVTPVRGVPTDLTIAQRSLLFYFGVECSSVQHSTDCLSASHVRIIKAKVHKSSSSLGFASAVSVLGYSVSTGWFHIFAIINDHTSRHSLSFVGLANCNLLAGVERVKAASQSFSGVSSRHPMEAAEDVTVMFDAAGDLKDELDPLSTFVALNFAFSDKVQIDIQMFEHLDIPTDLDSEDWFKQLPPFSSNHLEEEEEESFTVDIEAQSSPDQSASPSTRLGDAISSDFDGLINQHRIAFEERFQSVFGLTELATTEDNSNASFIPTQIEAAKVGLSSLLGGIGFFQGSSLIQQANIEIMEGSASDEKKTTEPFQEPPIFSSEVTLLTATPSRTAFPRGFLWDEGFHQMLISQWDTALTIEVISSWLQTMHYYCNESNPMELPSKGSCVGGWIPREMILGEEAMRRVPTEFIVQKVNVANPPTFLLVVESLMNRFSDATLQSKAYHVERTSVLRFLSDVYPLLHSWLQWFLNSQKGSPIFEGSFRWRCRSKSDGKVIPNTLSSGLDDYPRSPHPTPDEHHLDLHCWMTKGTGIMAKLGKLLSDEDKEFHLTANSITGDVDYYKDLHGHLLKRLDDLHWSEAHSGYFDVGAYNASNYFSQNLIVRCQNPTDRSMVDLLVPVDVIKQQKNGFCPASHPVVLQAHGDGRGGYRVIERYVMEQPYSITHIPIVGYVSIFPLLLKLLDPSSSRMGAVLDMIEDPEKLWTDYGLRSISKTDLFYQKRNSEGDAPYWR